MSGRNTYSQPLCSEKYGYHHLHHVDSHIYKLPRRLTSCIAVNGGIFQSKPYFFGI